jgi:hypothetical protein
VLPIWCEVLCLICDSSSLSLQLHCPVSRVQSSLGLSLALDGVWQVEWETLLMTRRSQPTWPRDLSLVIELRLGGRYEQKLHVLKHRKQANADEIDSGICQSRGVEGVSLTWSPAVGSFPPELLAHVGVTGKWQRPGRHKASQHVDDRHGVHKTRVCGSE